MSRKHLVDRLSPGLWAVASHKYGVFDSIWLEHNRATDAIEVTGSNFPRKVILAADEPEFHFAPNLEKYLTESR